MSEVIARRDPLMQEQVQAIWKGFRPVEKIIIGFAPPDNIDYKFGFGIIDENTKCIWTTSGIRLTFRHVNGSVAFVTRGREVDPYYSSGGKNNETTLS